VIKYRGKHLLRSGFIGTVLIILIIAVGLQPEQLTNMATALRYQAVFTEAGGLSVGNDVKIGGVKVGHVADVSLRTGDALVSFTVDSSVSLGSQTSAHIRTGSLLGERMLVLESAGNDRLAPLTVIPATRTSSPYSLTDAVSDLTGSVTDTDTASLNQSLDTLASTLDQIAPQLGPTFDALTRLSKSLNSRNATIAELLQHAGKVTGVLAQRSDQFNTLLLDGNDLMAVLVARRQAIVNLLNDTSALAKELSGLIADNEAELAPTLTQLNSVAAMLEKNRDNLATALPRLSKYITTLAETVSNGPYYTAMVPNLLPTQISMQPFLDYAFGFRRGNVEGQPPDNAGPRAEFPFPYNGIPGGPR
jgi:phospholipid/cholesterol/gamma-HCH transport system substrate-binding protein